ncbi:MAG: DUF3857 domain-containing transglutaminase family protein, partial [Acidobacteriaceae bacterium]
MRASLGLAMFLLGAVSAGHAAAPVQLPDWMTQAVTDAGARAPLPDRWKDARALYLLEDTLITVDSEGHALERYRAVVKILRQQGRDYATPTAVFSSDAKLKSFHVWSLGPDGHPYAMKDSEYTEVGVGGDSVLYEDDRARVAAPPGADPGGIVAWETVEQLPTYFREATWGFQNEVPTVRSVYEIDLPVGWHEEAVWSRHAPVSPVEVTPNHFRWEQANLDGIDLTDVPLAPAWAALAGHMTVHFAADPLPQGDALWTRIGNWYTSLAAPRSEGGSDLAAAARSVAGDGDFMAQLSGVADFMQQEIRYVAIEIGIGGWQPHAAEDVFHSRYGDCKDKATLMIAMLDAAGIRATWVSVDHRRGRIDPNAPSLFGDHMITAIEIPKGYENPRLKAVVTAKNGRRYLIFDPTNAYVPVGDLPENEQGGYGVLAAGGDSQVIQLPVLAPDADTTERTAKFELDANGTLKGDVTVTRLGASSWRLRESLAMESAKEQREAMEKSLQRDFSAFTLDQESMKNVRQLDEPVTLEYQVTAPSYAKSAGSLLLVRPRVVGDLAWGLSDKPRRVAISFDGLGVWRDDFVVKIPAGYTVDDVPDPVSVDAGFATYTSEVKAEGDVLH